MILLAVMLANLAGASPAPPPLAIEPVGPIDTVTLGPALEAPFACAEHASGQLPHVGDALGADCFVLAPSPAGFMTMHTEDGLANEDWHGWDVAVLAPLDARIVEVFVNPVINRPGRPGRPPGSMIVFQAEGGVRVVYAHVRDIEVGLGDTVRKGERVGVVGNDGMSRAPHVHIGAYRDLEPLQIRWDLRAMTELEGAGRRGDAP